MISSAVKLAVKAVEEDNKGRFKEALSIYQQVVDLIDVCLETASFEQRPNLLEYRLKYEKRIITLEKTVGLSEWSTSYPTAEEVPVEESKGEPAERSAHESLVADSSTSETESYSSEPESAAPPPRPPTRPHVPPPLGDEPPQDRLPPDALSRKIFATTPHVRPLAFLAGVAASLRGTSAVELVPGVHIPREAWNLPLGIPGACTNGLDGMPVIMSLFSQKARVPNPHVKAVVLDDICETLRAARAAEFDETRATEALERLCRRLAGWRSALHSGGIGVSEKVSSSASLSTRLRKFKVQKLARKGLFADDYGRYLSVLRALFDCARFVGEWRDRAIRLGWHRAVRHAHTFLDFLGDSVCPFILADVAHLLGVYMEARRNGFSHLHPARE